MNKKHEDKSKNLKLAFIFGIIFGFLLQKGGVAKYHILVKQLLLEDFTVIKIMMSAIVVGMIAHYYSLRKKEVENSIKPFQPYANIIGGLIFGVGFACAGFCPGTGAAALGQGDFEALYYMMGMMVGSYLYAEGSEKIAQRIKKRQDFGEITFPQLMNWSQLRVVTLFSSILIGILILLKIYF